jgi:MFS family permease
VQIGGSSKPGGSSKTSGSLKTSGSSKTWQAWREPRTLLIGLFVLMFAFAEGTGNDWSSLALIDGYHVSAAVGTLGFATFLSAMTVGRWFGPQLLDRYGRVPVIRALALVSLVGVLLFVFGGVTPVAFVGAVLWGAGLSLGFPVGMSAGADEAAMAPARVSVVASVGYCAFLAGPPLVGFLGDHVSVLRSVTAVAVALVVAALLTGSVRPLVTSRTAGERPAPSDPPAPSEPPAPAERPAPAEPPAPADPSAPAGRPADLGQLPKAG